MPFRSFWNRLRGNESRENEQIIRRDPLDRSRPPAAEPTPSQRDSTLGRPAREAKHGVASAAYASAAIEAFGMDLLKKECDARPERNVFLSPLSVYLALAMIENGAGGATRQAIRTALRIPSDATAETLNAEAKRLTEALNKKEGVELEVANAVWSDRQAPLEPDFVNTCELYFDAAARTLNMSDPESARLINDWVSQKTRGKITGMVSADCLRAAAAILTNAVYFKGKFLNPFPENRTIAKPFYLTSGKTKQVPMMQQAAMRSTYRSGNKCEAAALLYRGGEVQGYPRASEIELLAILPEKGIKPEEILNHDLSVLFHGPKRETILDLELPRFTLDFASSLVRSLVQMGMGIALEYPGADFAGTGSALFYLGNVIHQSRLEINEEGTVATAVTLEALETTSMYRPLPPEYKKLVFDRPFAVLLRDWKTGAFLFAGVVYEP
jgi:serine protease inhibitor